MASVAVIGSGAWATTAAKLLAENGQIVTQLVHRSDYSETINLTHTNPFTLPNIALPKTISATTDVQHIANASAWVICVPSKFINETLPRLVPWFRQQAIVSLCKGIQSEGPTLFISDTLSKVFKVDVAVLSGPNLAIELANLKPGAAVVASRNQKISRLFQVAFNTPYFRIYTSDDTRSVELGGILKNVYAIAAGLSDGLGLGANAKSALMTRGLVEMVQIGAFFSASAKPFYGLSGIGDLMTTAYSGLSRNWELGYQVAQNGFWSIDRGVPEGARTATQLCALLPNMSEIAPIFFAVDQIVNHGAPISNIVQTLMGRPLKAE